MNPAHSSLTLELAEYWRNQGLMSLEDFATYLHKWSQAPRFGNTFCRCARCRAEFPNRFLPEDP